MAEESDAFQQKKAAPPLLNPQREALPPEMELKEILGGMGKDDARSPSRAQRTLLGEP